MRVRVYLIGIALLSVACGSNNTGTSPSDTTAASTTERFDAILAPGGSAFFSFALTTNNGTVAINLASLSSLTSPGVLAVPMQIGYGVPAGEGCAVQKSILVTPALTSQLTATLRDGTYCASIADVGNLKASANFSIRVTHQ
jgi:major membrane immunogen (membrane-anchored lipoprotein)